MTYKPRHLERWTKSQNYFGAVWPNYFGAGVSQSAESDALDRSNFACMLRALGGASDTVIVVRESHWAFGWVEWLAIHQDDDRALRIADAIKGKLKGHPVIDDEHLSEVEYQDANVVWCDGYRLEDRIAYIREHRDQFEFHGFADMLSCVRGRLPRKAQRPRERGASLAYAAGATAGAISHGSARRAARRRRP
jgi:hypothetical protein